jgi:hypothetical protein
MAELRARSRSSVRRHSLVSRVVEAPGFAASMAALLALHSALDRASCVRARMRSAEWQQRARK